MRRLLRRGARRHRVMALLLGLAIGGAWHATAATAAAADRTAGLDVGHDILVDRAFVPSAQRPQGEVRIVRRGGDVVVQTLLYTRVLKRVFGAIGEKERRNWPAAAPGHADMERYVAALEQFRLAAVPRGDRGGAGQDRRVRALIEFIDASGAPGASLVAIGGVDLDGEGEAIRIRGRAAPAILELTEGYVRGNMRLIVADAFHLTPQEAEARLAKAAGR